MASAAAGVVVFAWPLVLLAATIMACSMPGAEGICSLDKNLIWQVAAMRRGWRCDDDICRRIVRGIASVRT